MMRYVYGLESPREHPFDRVLVRFSSELSTELTHHVSFRVARSLGIYAGRISSSASALLRLPI